MVTVETRLKLAASTQLQMPPGAAACSAILLGTRAQPLLV